VVDRGGFWCLYSVFWLVDIWEVLQLLLSTNKIHRTKSHHKKVQRTKSNLNKIHRTNPHLNKASRTKSHLNKVRRMK
jgi:hypothetical protein